LGRAENTTEDTGNLEKGKGRKNRQRKEKTETLAI